MRPKALIVEDDDSTRHLLRKLVESQGCDVEEAIDVGTELGVGVLVQLGLVA